MFYILKLQISCTFALPCILVLWYIWPRGILFCEVHSNLSPLLIGLSVFFLSLCI